MIGVDEDKSKIHKRVEEVALAASPVLKVTAEAMVPMLEAMAAAFRKAGGHAREAVESLFDIRRKLSRPPARKPCAWCSKGSKRPATHTVKWREPVVWWDEFDGTPTLWPARRVMRMCEFHAQIAERYNGVKAYRFRRLR